MGAESLSQSLLYVCICRVQVILSLEEAVLRPGEHSLFLQPLFGFMLQIAYDEGDDSSSLQHIEL